VYFSSITSLGTLFTPQTTTIKKLDDLLIMLDTHVDNLRDRLALERLHIEATLACDH
jgi:hypothetical protein